MKCLSCKHGDMLPSTTTYFTEFNSCMLIIKNVPCMKCEQCGEVVFSTSVHRKIEHIVANVKKLTSELTSLEYDNVA